MSKHKRAERAIAQGVKSIHYEWLSPTSRAHLLHYNDPGVPLRSTPGFMLSPTHGLKEDYPSATSDKQIADKP